MDIRIVGKVVVVREARMDPRLLYINALGRETRTVYENQL